MCWFSYFLHSVFKLFRSSLLSLLWISFQVVCLFPLCLLGLDIFYLGSSFSQYFSASFFFFCNLLCLMPPFPRLYGHVPSSFWFMLSVHKFGQVVSVGFLIGVTCSCILVGGGEFFFLSWWAGLCEVVCFRVFVTILSADYWVLFLSYSALVRHLALGAASSWVMPGPIHRWRHSWKFSQINTPWW